MKNKLFIGAAVVLVVLLGVVVFGQKTVPLGGEIPVSLSQSSTSTVGAATTTKLFDSKTFCNVRTIYSPDQTIYLTFGTPQLNVTGTIASSTLSTSTFHWRQATDTITSYDSSTYGCGEWWVIPSATTTLIKSEF